MARLSAFFLIDRDEVQNFVGRTVDLNNFMVLQIISNFKHVSGKVLSEEKHTIPRTNVYHTVVAVKAGKDPIDKVSHSRFS